MSRPTSLVLTVLGVTIAASAVDASPTYVSEEVIETLGSLPYGWLGTSVASIDFDDDGYDDLVVGEPGYGGFAGVVHIFRGGASADSIPDWTLPGAAAGDFLGASCANAGDFNGDGCEDLVVGAPESNQYATKAGRAYVFFGGASADSIPDVELLSPSPGFGYRFGTCVAGVSDFDGDGRTDVAVGAPNAAGNLGRVYFFWGGPSPDGVSDALQEGVTISGNFGRTISVAGDVNEDGQRDLLIGAPAAPASNIALGEVFLYHGGVDPHGPPAMTFTAENMPDNFGGALAGLGDVSGDGMDDFLIGASYYSTADSIWVGRAYVHFGGSQLTTTPDYTFTGTNEGQRVGAAAVALGDVNCDGRGDFVVGSPGVSGTFGQAIVLHGDPTPLPFPAYGISGTQTGEFFAGALAAGDFDGNGTRELFVTAATRSKSVVLPDAGAAWVYRFVPAGTGVSPGSFPGEAGVHLSAPWPNPLRGHGESAFRLTLPADDSAEITLLDAAGRILARRPEEPLGRGDHLIRWDPGRLVSGVYFVRLRTGSGAVRTTKWTVAR